MDNGLVCGLIQAAGGALLAAGCSRAVAFIAFGELALAYWMVHVPARYYPLVNGGDLAVMFCFALLLFVFDGPGAWSFDSLLTKRAPKSTTRRNNHAI